ITLTINAPLGSDSSMMLDGLMSRCTTPHFSAAASARAACSITSNASARDVRMMNLCGGARFAQETRSDSRHLRDFSVYDFKSDDGIQNRVACTISNRHCASAELDRKAICADFHFKVIVLQWSRRQSPGCFRSSWLFTAAQKT